MRVAHHLPLKTIRLPLKLQESIDYISTHLVIVWYLEFSDAIILQVSKKRALYSKYISYI